MLPHVKYVSAGLGDCLSLLHWEAMEGVKDLMRIHLISAVNFSSTTKVGWDNEGESETNNNTKWRKQTRTTVLPLLSQGQPKHRKYESLTHALGRQEYGALIQGRCMVRDGTPWGVFLHVVMEPASPFLAHHWQSHSKPTVSGLGSHYQRSTEGDYGSDINEAPGEKILISPSLSSSLTLPVRTTWVILNVCSLTPHQYSRECRKSQVKGRAFSDYH